MLYVILFQRQNKVFTQNLVNLVVVTLYFDLGPPFNFLKWHLCFFNFSTSPNVNNLSIDYSEKYVQVYGIRTIAPQGKYPLPLLKIGAWVKARVSFRVGRQPDNCPPFSVRVWVRFSFGVGGNFPQGQLS